MPGFPIHHYFPEFAQTNEYLGLISFSIYGLIFAKSWLIGKDPDPGKDWGQEEKGQQRMRRLDGITDSMDMSLISWLSTPLSMFKMFTEI